MCTAISMSAVHTNARHNKHCEVSSSADSEEVEREKKGPSASLDWESKLLQLLSLDQQGQYALSYPLPPPHPIKFRPDGLQSPWPWGAVYS